MKWNLFYSTTLTLLLVIGNPSFSKNIKNIQNGLTPSIFNSQGNWFISLGGGTQFPALNSYMKVNNDSEFPEPFNRDRYSITNDNGGLIAASVGRRWQNNNFWLPSYSLSLFWQHFFKMHIRGEITLYSLPEFTNYNYNLDFVSNLLLASGQINLFQYGIVSPYINGGIGSSFNHVSNYSEEAFSGVTPRVSPGFRGSNTSEFAYNVGVGIDMHILPQLMLSVGYLYQDLGPISSGHGIATWTEQLLNPGSYRSNEVLVTATYLFGKETH
ncbi:TPA: outer membrane protein [Legionella bozemanae]|uniref:outer membrane protein n=1 Tax=Legionella bozemanae TaxID=447 RepID=UPI0010415799|nr:outer membrane beta-barrel protein [Legionella bozemanae]